MPEEKSRGGRPTKYKPEYVDQAAKLCKLGATDAELADFFEVSVSTVSLWKVQHPEFSEAIKPTKETADSRVERSLYQRAVGYEHDEVDIRVVGGEIVITPIRKHYPPDSVAAIFWLKNRQGWRDKTEQEITGPGGGPVVGAEVIATLASMTPEQLRAMATKPLKDE